MFQLCPPALIYVAFSITQIIIDLFKGMINTAFFKMIVMIIVTLLLNSLCQSGLSIVSWLIVSIPFIFMSVIVAILLIIFGLDPSTGAINMACPTNTTDNASTDGNASANDNASTDGNVNDNASTDDSSPPPPYWSSEPLFG